MSQARVVIQARLSSHRLPGKSLLTIRGYPVAALSALRAANRGAEVVVATSTDPTDDALAEELEERDIRVFRGSLDDVLGRYEAATRDLPDDAELVRLTADNVVPDGTIIEKALGAFRAIDDEYLGTCEDRDGLPRGLRAEVFTVRLIREANRLAASEYQREHVTPWIIERYSGQRFLDHTDLGLPDLSDLCCTIDTFQDYINVCKIFARVKDPVSIHFGELVGRCNPRPD